MSRGATDYRALCASIIRSSRDAVVGLSLDGYLTFWNQCAEQISGYSAEEAVGRHASFLAPSERKSEVSALIERVKRGEAVANFETNRITKDGRLLDVSLSLFPVRDDHGVLAGILGIARDFTALRKAEMRIRDLAADLARIARLASVSPFGKARGPDADPCDIITRTQKLTPRERDLLNRLMLGRTNKIIAIELRISPRTVEHHRSHLMQKMEADDLSHLMRMMAMAGIKITEPRSKTRPGSSPDGATRHSAPIAATKM